MTDDLMALVRRAEAACDDFDRGMDAHADAGERPDLWGQCVEFPVSDLRAMATAIERLATERDEARELRAHIVKLLAANAPPSRGPDDDSTSATSLISRYKAALDKATRRVKELERERDVTVADLGVAEILRGLRNRVERGPFRTDPNVIMEVDLFHMDQAAGAIASLDRQLGKARASLAAGQAEAEKAKAVVAAAHEWLCDRQVSDHAEQALFAALIRHDPSKFGKEACDCGDQDNCDECPTRAQIERTVAEIEARAALAKGGRDDG